MSEWVGVDSLRWSGVLTVVLVGDGVFLELVVSDSLTSAGAFLPAALPVGFRFDGAFFGAGLASSSPDSAASAARLFRRVWTILAEIYVVALYAAT